ncbi:hypothetical protein DFP80_10433 [Marinomonas rhizomae]|uniref:DUF4139 domain-containing protein n=2 Tax=Marinomonas rhizomae TaxID=491948 RepID=A0A366JCI1_9GAMM|nr:hypothetical protein DFP80_10433 [Marinomonas rhizomae]
MGKDSSRQPDYRYNQKDSVMNKQPVYFCLSILLGATTHNAFASPLNAVIGLDNSQIVETSKQLSLHPNSGSLLPLQDNFAPITHLENDVNANWFDLINQKVRVEHKQRELNYTGTLAKIEQNTRSFVLSNKEFSMTLPMDDFYLIPLENSNSVDTKTKDKTDTNKATPYKVSYQTNELSWTPQLSLIFDGDNVSISQQALIHNNSSSTIEIQNSLLHYSRSSAPRLYKAERSSLAMSTDRADVNYQDNEVSYSLGGAILSIAPYSNTLIPLPSSKSTIDKQTQKAKLYTYGSNSGKISLNFYNNVSFSLRKNGLPGEYKTFWKRGDLLIPGNTMHLDTNREGRSVSVMTNKSQDITGYLTLVSASSQKLPSTQVWKATIENHSNTPQQYSIEQSTNGVVEVLEGSDVVPINANSLIISGEIKANSQKTITYKVDVKN